MSTDITFEDITRIQLRQSKITVNEELDNQMEYLFNTYVIPECKAYARAANAPAGFVAGFAFVKTGRNRGKIINTFGSKDLPLAKWWNYGTKKNYPIEPIVLHPEGSVRAERDKDDVGDDHVQHPSVLKIPLADGTFIFRKRVIHPGIEASLAMERGYELGIKRLIPNVSKELKEKFSNE